MACPGPAQVAARRLSYWQWGAPDAAHTVVCVHGLTRQGRDFDVLAQALLARADVPIRVICPDMAGRGASDRLPDPQHYQVPTYVADSLQLLAHLHREAPLTVLDWVGTSMGGLIGMLLCGTPDLPVPVPVRRLVINDIGPTMDWQALQRIGAYVGQAGRFESEEQAAQVLAQLSVGFGPHTPEQWMALSRPMLRALPEGGYTLHYDPAIGLPFRAVTEEAARKGEAAVWQAWDRITAQTLLLRGAQSDLLSTATAQAMTQRGPRARLLEFPGVGHAPTLVSPQQYEPVVAFLLA